MSESTQEISEQLERLVQSTRGRLRRNAVLLGLGLLIIAGVGGVSAGAVLDMLLAFPVWLRITAGIVLLLLVGTTFTLLVFWPAIRPMGLEHIAYLIECIVGKMHNSLVTVIDLRRRRKIREDRIQPLEDRLIRQTAERLTDYRVQRIADPRPLRKVALAACLTLVLAGILSFQCRERISTAALRLLMPTKSIPPVTSVRLQAFPGDTSVLYGEPLRLWAGIEGEKLDHLTLRLWNDKGEYSTYPMQRENDQQFAYTLSSVNASYHYQVIGGGTWTVPNRITVIYRPILETMTAEIQLPEYMKILQPQPVNDLSRQISAPNGSMIQLAAVVKGDVTEGKIHLFRAGSQVIEQNDIQETVWFDDDIPVDAEEMGKWRWTSDRAYSGTQAHTFNWSRQPYGFRTRLHPLILSAGESLFVYVWIDPQDGPGRVSIRVLAGATTCELMFDSSAAPLTGEQKENLRQPIKLENPQNWFGGDAAGAPEVLGRYAGPLPEAGSWKRLEIPSEKFAGPNPAGPFQVNGLQFQIDKGTILFDRAGSLKSVQLKTEQTNLEEINSVPMQYDPSKGRWIGAIPAAECHFTLEFRNRLGYANAAMQAIPILPTDDQPPTVLIERPGKNLALPAPQAVPLVIRACDDFGVAHVFMQTGVSPDQLGQPQELAQYDQPQVNCKVITSLDMKSLKLVAEQPLYYRIFAQDFKGQTGVSELFQLRLDISSTENIEETDRVNHALTGILENIQNLVDFQGQLSDGAAENVIPWPAGYEVNVDESGAVTLLNPDGTVMTAEDMKRMLNTWNEGISPQQRQQLNEIYSRIQQERQELLDLSETLYQAAEENTMLTLPAEAEALRVMALRAQQITSLFPAGDANILSEEVLLRLEGLQELTPDQKQELAQLQRQLREIISARQDLAGSPNQSQQSLSNLMAELQARQAREQLQGLNTYLESQQETLERLRLQVKSLQQTAANAPPQDLDEISDQQQELDPNAIELMKQVQELLQKQREKQDQNRETMPLAPWVPPGRLVDAMPVEADTPEEDPAQPSQPDVAGMKDQLKELLEKEELNWWDRPVNLPADAQRGSIDPRFADRDSRPHPASPGEASTPRAMLIQHQDQLQQRLTANSNDLNSVQNQLAQTIHQLDQYMSGSEKPQVQSLLNMLSSPDMRQAMDLSGWVARNLYTQGNSFGLAGGSTMRSRMGSVSALKGRAITIGYTNEDTAPVEGAALYRLPPWLRQPLIQGMQEHGPQAYQPLIEAYYRDLSTQLEK